MEANRTRRRWTYAEFARLPSEGGTRYEVIDGELVVTRAPSLGHQRVVGRLFAILHVFVRTRGLGEAFVSPVDVLFAEGDYMEPDIVFVRADRSGILTDRGIEGRPDLVVEVLSPSTAARDRKVKLDRYRHFGVGEYWAVDPDERTTEVWHLSARPHEPVTHDQADVLRWTPVVGASLEIGLNELFDANGP